MAYINGSYRPLRAATVNIEDRGYQFGDGIYEVIYVLNGRLVDSELHLARLAPSLQEILIDHALTPAALTIVIGQVLHRNRVATGLVYIQVTRGVARQLQAVIFDEMSHMLMLEPRWKDVADEIIRFDASRSC